MKSLKDVFDAADEIETSDSAIADEILDDPFAEDVQSFKDWLAENPE